MPEKTRYEKTLKEKAAFKLVDDILDNLPEDQQQAALESVGLEPESAAYYNVARQVDDAKFSYVLDKIDEVGDDRAEIINMLIQGRAQVNSKMIVSNGVLDDLYEAGIISSSERTQLKKIKLDGDGNQIQTGSGGKSAAKSKFEKAMTALVKEIGQEVIKGPDIQSVDALIKDLKNSRAPQMQVSASTANPSMGRSASLTNRLASNVPKPQDLIKNSQAQAGSGIASARELINRSRMASPQGNAGRLSFRYGGSRA